MHEVGSVAIDLPPARDARRCQMPRMLPRLILRDDLRQLGPWTDQAHRSAQHIPELGQLVEATAPQETTDRRDAWIVGRLVGEAPLGDTRRRTQVLVAAVGNHGSKLDHY